MKKNLILTILLLQFRLLSQGLQPEFEFKIYAEDSKGNKDSVIIGYDHQANTDISIDTRFGDSNIGNIKFDSIFEMRVHKVTYLPVKTSSPVLQTYGVSKRITLHYNNGASSNNCLPYGRSAYGFILIKAKYPPIKIYWNKKEFDKIINPCIGRSYFLFNEYFTQEYPPEKIPYTVYLEETSLIIDSVRSIPTEYVNGFPNNTNQKIRIRYFDNTMDTIQLNYQFQFQNNGIRTAIEDESIIKITKSYPNPCQSVLNVLLPITSLNSEALTTNIFDTNGSLIKVTCKISENIITMDTSTLEVGFYILKIIDINNKIYISQFIKS